MILPSLLKNLSAGMRLAFFLPVRALDYRASALDYGALVAFNFIFWLAAAAARAGFEGELDTTAVFVYFASVPLVLATALALGRVYGAPLLLFAVALTASDLAFEIGGLALPYLAALTGSGPSLFFLFFGWLWLVTVRAAVVCGGMRKPQFYQGALAVSAMMAVALFLFPKVEVWQAPQEEDAPAALAEERLFHRQGELIERALAAVRPGIAGERETYFVGFAPDASQDVFLREMRFVGRLFEERFGTAGRSVILASSQDALDELPIGSVTNLSRALARVGQAMNPEDVLVLFVSAHGDREHRLSAWQPPLELAPLTPTALARLLQDSGIKWRVVVVSACYSGGFIEPLRDDNSIVITAAAPDRSSFGCEAGRDFTYFGQAFFRDALAQTRSFVEAFETAKALVARQEAEEKLTPSLPQIAVGRAISAHLGR